METPYVVKLHRVSRLAAPVPVFSFLHPSPGQPSNARYAALQFSTRGNAPAAICHGFAGYFSAKLFDSITLSTEPSSHTPNMFSWFPIFFPLKEPVTCPSGCTIELQMWRRTSSHKVWYEWALTQPCSTSIHNPQGRSYHVGL